MGMSYRKAWLLVDEMQTTFNHAIVTTETGGTGGGGMQLTALGATLLKTYRRIEADVMQASQLELRDLAAMVQTNAAPRRTAKRKRNPPAGLKNRRPPRRRGR
jgi:molybdate transport system regulatory protein